eukprot:c20848_g2_i1 orf=1-318(-)
MTELPGVQGETCKTSEFESLLRGDMSVANVRRAYVANGGHAGSSHGSEGFSIYGPRLMKNQREFKGCTCLIQKSRGEKGKTMMLEEYGASERTRGPVCAVCVCVCV